MSDQRNNDLNVDQETYASPLGGDAGDGAQDKGPVTFGTTCWGTPCPSANTVSC